MKDSKLIYLLKTFSKTEFRDFEKFVSSPYFGRGRDLMPLFKALKTFYPEFSSKDFTFEKVYGIIFPGKVFGDARSDSLMKTLISELYKMCIDFLAYQSLREDEGRRSYYVLDQLRKRKHYVEFEREFERIIKQDNDSIKGGTADFIEKYFLCSVFKNYSLDKDDFINSFEYTIAADENIVAAALMMTFMIEDVKNISKGYNLPLRYSLMSNLLENLDSEKLLEEMKKNEDKFYPYVLIFYMIYKMNRYRDNKEHFYELKKLLIGHKDLFCREVNHVLWNIMLTYINVNCPSASEYIALCEYMLENNIHKKTESEDFHIILFRNLVVDFTSSNQVEKLEHFINKYSSELHKDHRDNMYNFSYAHLHFIKGNFDKALEHAGKINYDIFIFKMDARLLLLKIYFELSYFEQAGSLIDSTLQFIRVTGEFSDVFKNYYSELVKNFQRLLKLKTSGTYDRDSVSLFEKKIRETIPSGNTEWMMKKIGEMKQK